MIKVFIVDDHCLLRAGVRMMLENNMCITIVGESGTASDVLQVAKLNSQFCDVLLLDIALPDASGIDVLRQMTQICPGLPILIVSMYPEDQYAVRVIREGASGYLTKESAPEQLIKAITKLASGGKYITPSIAEKLADALSNSTKLPHQNLSKRELEIFIAISQGDSLTDIANRLGLSIKTVSTYRARVLDKMGMNRNSEIVKYVITKQLNN